MLNSVNYNKIAQSFPHMPGAMVTRFKAYCFGFILQDATQVRSPVTRSFHLLYEIGVALAPWGIQLAAAL